MAIYDITLLVHPKMPVWPGDPPVKLDRVSKIEDGEIANVTRLDMSAHTGTHVDAPFHFLLNGGTVEGLDLEVLTGPAVVREFPDAEIIKAQHLEAANIPQGTRRLLLKTRNSAGWQQNPETFDVNYVAVDADAAEWLVAQGIALVGVDYLSVAPFEDVVPTHITLLQAGVVILEGLDLSGVTPANYDLYCLPLKIAGSDGAPARAILVDRP